MKKIIIMELILAFSIFYLVKYVPNYKKIHRKGARSLYNNREKW